MEYPEEIYATLDGGLLTESQRSRAVAMWPRRRAYEVGYAKGKAEQTTPLEGYSNLTEAIRTGKSIDWEKMKGVKVKCVNHIIGTLRGELKRNTAWSENGVAGWYKRDMDPSYVNAFVSAWGGEDGWTLWVEGEIPLRRKTADQLEPGYFFTGVLSGTTSEVLMCVASGPGIGKNIRYASDLRPSFHPGTKWVVLEEHGPFQKPEGE